MKPIVFVLTAGLLFASTAMANDDKKPPPSQPPASDSGLYFTKNDKTEHAAIGAMLGLAGRLQFRDNRWHALAVPAAVSALKEIADSTQPGNRFDGKDLAAGIAGGFLGMVLADGAIYLTRSNGTTKVVLVKVPKNHIAAERWPWVAPLWGPA